MKNKETMLEELDKMKNLMVAKAGTVISEQENVGSDVGTIMQELNKSNSDEKKIVNIVKKYTTKDSFKNFLNQYKSISGKDFGGDMYKAIQPYNDKTEWNDLKSHLATLGVTLGNQVKGNYSWATFTGLDTPAVDQQKTPSGYDMSLTKTTEKPKTPSGYDMSLTKTTEKPKTPENKKKYQTNKPQVQQRFSKSLSSLGIQNGKMDVQTLQTILNSLETGSQVQSTPKPTTNDDLVAILNKLESGTA